MNRTEAELFTPNDALRLTELKRQALEDGIEVREEVEIFANGDIFVVEDSPPDKAYSRPCLGQTNPVHSEQSVPSVA